MSDLTNIGHLITTDQERDAIHVAVAPVVAGMTLYRGESIGLNSEGKAFTSHGDIKGIGIVDPFLKTDVAPGQKFWMFLYPNTIMSLRHDWTHPAFKKTESKNNSASETWLRAFAARSDVDLDYDELMWAAKDFLRKGDYLCDGGRWESFDFPDDFWIHYENVTGIKVPEDKRRSFFSCSC